VKEWLKSLFVPEVKTALLRQSDGTLKEFNVEEGASGYVCHINMGDHFSLKFVAVRLLPGGNVDGKSQYVEWHPHKNWSGAERKLSVYPSDTVRRITEAGGCC
jgi:hypothetical protein